MIPSALSVWVVDDDESVRWVLEQALHQARMIPRCFESGADLFEALEAEKPDVLITDIRMPGMSGLELMDRVTTNYPGLPVIVITAHSDLDSTVAAYKGGAFEYLTKPFDVDDAIRLVSDAAHQRVGGKRDTQQPAAVPGMIGHAQSMQEVFRAIGRLSRSSMNVLITGESGTGKELVARALHQNSPRAARPFVALNTSAIAQDLLEPELFGHEKGSFTGAAEQRIGRFEQADGGTLFLDEIGDMSVDLQTRLLRVLAESEFFRVGGQRPVRVDVRVIAATNQKLDQEIRQGHFRADLFHRLNVMAIEVPPLRARREDIPNLVKFYMNQAASELGAEPKTLSRAALEVLVNYNWPGNVRELVNMCRRITVKATGKEVVARDIHHDLSGSDLGGLSTDWTSRLTEWAEGRLVSDGASPLLSEALPAFERALILVALRQARGKRLEAAKILGWGRNTLTRKIKEHGLEELY